MIRTVFIIWVIAMGLIAFCMFGIDKRKAVKGQWRIPEAQLLTSAALGGGIGAWLGMRVFRHKTMKKKFTILVPLFTVCWCILAMFIFVRVQ